MPSCNRMRNGRGHSSRLIIASCFMECAGSLPLRYNNVQTGNVFVAQNNENETILLMRSANNCSCIAQAVDVFCQLRRREYRENSYFCLAKSFWQSVKLRNYYYTAILFCFYSIFIGFCPTKIQVFNDWGVTPHTPPIFTPLDTVFVWRRT